jgi:hypothetical protein
VTAEMERGVVLSWSFGFSQRRLESLAHWEVSQRCAVSSPLHYS